MVKVPQYRPTAAERLRKRHERAASESEKQRYTALNTLPHDLFPALFEASPVPTFVYAGGNIAGVNAAAVRELGYPYAQILTFNDPTVATGSRKARLDDILTPCARQGWDEIDLELRFPTIDAHEIRMDAHFYRHVVSNNDYWIAFAPHITKINPKTFTSKARNLIQRVFEKEVIYVRAPAYLDKEFVGTAIRHVASNDKNLVVDLRRVRGTDEDAIKLIKDFHDTWKDRLHLINPDEQCYRVLTYHRIPANSIYRKNAYVTSPAPA